jgi:tetratricopeptide (TPR) repeat protein
MPNYSNNGNCTMKEELSPDELSELHQLRRADPRRFLEVMDEWLRENPKNFRPYITRHFVWSDLGQPRRALDDLDRAIELAPSQGAFCARGRIYRQLGEHANALADFKRGEAINPKEWKRQGITILYEADSYAHLGDEVRALDCCSRLPDDFWTPGLDGAPGGGKAEIVAELRRIAAEAQDERR